MASRDKIATRRGKDKWLSDAELERWTQTHGPVGVVVRPAQGLGVVEPQHHEAEEVHPDRPAPASQWCAHGLGIIAARPAPYDLRVGVPGQPGVVENGTLDRGEPNRKEPEHEAAGQWEAQLRVRHGYTRADQLVELSAAVLRGAGETLVVDEGPGGVAAEQVGIPEERPEQVGVPSDAAVEQAPDSECERPGEEVAPPVDQARGELPGAEAGGSLEPPAGARERSHPPEQRVVVDQRELGTVVGDGRSIHRDRIIDADQEALLGCGVHGDQVVLRSEEHTSELQSLAYLVCRLLLEKKKKQRK